MNDIQIEKLMETAQKAFIEDLETKLSEVENLLKINKNQCTDQEIGQLLRFFHSIHGTAATVGLNHLSAIGREWENKLKNYIDSGLYQGNDLIEDIGTALKTIKKNVSEVSGSNIKADTIDEGIEYTNIPDRGKILLVDDDITILKLLEHALSKEGYKVYICGDSESALDTIAISRPDIVILDIMMPKIDGYELLEMIKAKHEYIDMFVIFLSAKSETEDKIKGIKYGADDYIIKPFTIGEVITRVEMLLRRSVKYREKLLKDYLTDAYSRYYFNLKIAEEIERFRRSNSLFSIAFIDIDHFKVINDQYGHQTGDYVLKELVFHIMGSIRNCDSIYRFGGEEFIIIMPDTTEKDANSIINRVRQEFSNLPIQIGGEKLYATFSAGIKQIQDMEETAEQLIGDADRAMYQAKINGRNQVVIYSFEMESPNKKKTLLIVDDENTILKLLLDRLNNIGYNVITAKDGNSAIKAVNKTHPDAVILDLVLPDIDGFEVCRQIKENQLTHSTKIIMLSKKKQKKTIVEGFNIGADDYLTKPFSMAELEARIMRLLNQTT